MQKGKDGKFIAELCNWNSDKVFSVIIVKKQKNFLSRLMPKGISFQLLGLQGRREVKKSKTQPKLTEKLTTISKEESVETQLQLMDNSNCCPSSKHPSHSKPIVEQQKVKIDKVSVVMSRYDLKIELQEKLVIWLNCHNLLEKCKTEMQTLRMLIIKKNQNPGSKISLYQTLDSLTNIAKASLGKNKAENLLQIVQKFKLEYNQFKNSHTFKFYREQKDKFGEESTISIESVVEQKNGKMKQLLEKKKRKSLKKMKEMTEKQEDTVLEDKRSSLQKQKVKDEKSAIPFYQLFKSQAIQAKHEFVRDLVKDEASLVLKVLKSNSFKDLINTIENTRNDNDKIMEKQKRYLK